MLLYNFFWMDEVVERVTKLKMEVLEQQARREEAAYMASLMEARRAEAEKLEAEAAAKAQRRKEELAAEREEKIRLREEQLRWEAREEQLRESRRQEKAEKKKEQARRHLEKRQRIQMAKHPEMVILDAAETISDQMTEEMIRDKERRQREKELWMRGQEAYEAQDLDTLEWVFYELNQLELQEM